MRNILLNLHLSHLKCFLKTGQTFCPLSINLKKCILEYQKASLRVINTKALSTSVENVEKSTNVNTSTKKESSIIYMGTLTYQVKGVKMFTCISSIGGIIIQPWMLMNIFNGNNLPLGVALFSCVGFFTFVTPFLIHMLTKKYVTEIWYNSTSDTYTATLLSFFLRRININFKAEDVQVPYVLPVFTTMYIKGKPVFIVSDSFLDSEHYVKMMGYDKPIDLNQSSDKEK